MKYSAQEIILGFLKTAALLIFLEVFTSAVLPAFGIVAFKPAFNVLVVLYLAFKIEVPVLPFLILSVQYIHSFFSIEGWAIGTLTGILVAVTVRHVKDMLNFSTAVSTIIVVQVFQLAWFSIVSFVLCLKMGDFGYFFSLFFKYIPESFILSLLSYHFFLLLDNFWQVNSKRSTMGY